VIISQVKILMRYAEPLQAGSSRVSNPFGSLEIFIDLILPAAILPRGRMTH